MKTPLLVKVLVTLYIVVISTVLFSNYMHQAWNIM